MNKVIYKVMDIKKYSVMLYITNTEYQELLK